VKCTLVLTRSWYRVTPLVVSRQNEAAEPQQVRCKAYSEMHRTETRALVHRKVHHCTTPRYRGQHGLRARQASWKRTRQSSAALAHRGRLTFLLPVAFPSGLTRPPVQPVNDAAFERVGLGLGARQASIDLGNADALVEEDLPVLGRPSLRNAWRRKTGECRVGSNAG